MSKGTLSLLVASLLLSACAEGLSPSDSALGSDDEFAAEYGVDSPLDTAVQSGKDDTVAGPYVSWENTDTVWAIRHQWTDVTPEAGLAWSANSGLDWEEKYAAWVQSLETASRNSGGTTFQITTPDGRTMPAPSLECAEVAIFLRVTFASWYGLPFFLKAYSGGQNIYLGHFGFRNADGSRFRGTPRFSTNYTDYTNSWNGTGTFPSDSALRARGLYGGGDEVPFLPEVNGEPARAGAYFDTFFLNKRTGHFMLLALSWFGSMHLASESNMYHITAESTRAGDVLLHRWQRSGIGHTIPVMRVDRPIDTRLQIAVATGSMPRRQPVWEEGASVRWYFTSDYAGGEGENTDGDTYATLGGGIRRWRIPVRNGARYYHSYPDSSIRIAASNTESIASRPDRFTEILQEVTPAAMRDAALGRIQASRTHLEDHPSSCAARERRVSGFETLYEVMQESFGMSKAQTDATYRTLADYVFAELEYSRSRSCCWNSTTHNMYEIIMAYAEAEQNAAAANGECVSPTVFMGRNNGSGGDGFQIYQNYAQTIGRGNQWVAWSADETCSQQNVVNDTERTHEWTSYCSVDWSSGGSTGGGTTTGGDDGNDSPGSATLLSPGTVSGSISSSTDVDYYQIEIASTQSVEIELRFSHNNGAGDIDMSLQNSGGDSVGLAQSSSDNEVLTPTLAAGTYTLKVYGYNGAQADYQLEFTLADVASSSTCGDAGTSVATAQAVSGNQSGLRVCSNESDFWSYTPNFSGTLRATIRFQHSRGDLDMAAYWANGESIQTSESTSDVETLDVTVTSGQRVIFRVYGYSGATGDYSLEIGQN